MVGLTAMAGLTAAELSMAALATPGVEAPPTDQRGKTDDEVVGRGVSVKRREEMTFSAGEGVRAPRCIVGGHFL